MPRLHVHLSVLLGFAVPFLLAPVSSRAEVISASEGAEASNPAVDDALPDSPGASLNGSAGVHTPAVVPPVAPKHQGTIKEGQTALPWAGVDKMAYAGRSILSVGGFAGNVISAGISHWDDSRPHFGTDSAGFGERLGSTVYRSSVKSLFGFGVLPTVFHDDPRYYVLGSTHTFQQRALYAGTRVVIARKDDGGRGINWPQLIAPVIAQGSANGFYPARDQAVGKTATGILVSYATTAGTNEASEFLGPLFHKLLHR